MNLIPRRIRVFGIIHPRIEIDGGVVDIPVEGKGDRVIRGVATCCGGDGAKGDVFRTRGDGANGGL